MEFNSPDQKFDASLANKMAAATNGYKVQREIAEVKALVYGVIQRYADFGRSKCEWSWPLPTSPEVRAEVVKELESRSFTVVEKEASLTEKPRNGMVPARDGIIINW
mgnify:CR=1 FL=1